MLRVMGTLRAQCRGEAESACDGQRRAGGGGGEGAACGGHEWAAADPPNGDGVIVAFYCILLHTFC